MSNLSRRLAALEGARAEMKARGVMELSDAELQQAIADAVRKLLHGRPWPDGLADALQRIDSDCATAADGQLLDRICECLSRSPVVEPDDLLREVFATGGCA